MRKSIYLLFSFLIILFISPAVLLAQDVKILTYYIVVPQEQVANAQAFVASYPGTTFDIYHKVDWLVSAKSVGIIVTTPNTNKYMTEVLRTRYAGRLVKKASIQMKIDTINDNYTGNMWTIDKSKSAMKSGDFNRINELLNHALSAPYDADSTLFQVFGKEISKASLRELATKKPDGSYTIYKPRVTVTLTLLGTGGHGNLIVFNQSFNFQREVDVTDLIK